jgi:DNA-directed RNA polymerase subunit M/transcription elongation factor TFIIS
MLPQEVCPECLAYMIHDERNNNVGWLKCICCGYMTKERKAMITAKEVLGEVKQEDLSDEFKNNLEELLKRVNLFRKEYGIPMYVNSGYRSEEHNAKIGGAKGSAHMTCEAVDFRDNDGKLFEFIKNDPAILERCDLYMENPGWTNSWIHLQSRPTKSGKRIFIPYSDGRAATAPEREIKP